jgi:hypothetical protein
MKIIIHLSHMKTLQLTLICVFITLFLNAQLPPFQWANKMEGGSSKALAIDDQGNSYFVGEIGSTGNYDVDPGPGVFTLNGANGIVVIFKLNTAGGFVWAKQMPDINTEGIRVDAAQNVYLGGHYSLTKDFDPGPAVYNLTGVGQNDIFSLKLDASGNFLWAKSQGGAQADLAFSIAISASGIYYSTGYFAGTSDFDPGPGVFNMTAVFLQETFISALDADGNFLWAKQLGGGQNSAKYITTNVLGNIIIAGTFSGTIDFDPGAGVTFLTSGAGDVFILKLDAIGNFIWAKSVGGTSVNQAESVALDPFGNVYATGRFNLTADFDPGPGTFNLTAAGNTDGITDVFVLKLAANGNFVWAKQMGSPAVDVGNDIATDAEANVYTTGFFQGIADFDPGAAIFNLTSKGSADIFISKLTTDGNFVWAVSFGSGSADRGEAITADAAGSVYCAGNFLGEVDFDPGPGTAILDASTNETFVLKFAPGVVLPLTLLRFSATAAANGNFLQWQTSQEINTKHFEIEWSDDGQTFEKIALQKAAGNSATLVNYSFLNTVPVNGDNYYRLKMIDIDGRFTYSKTVQVNTTLVSIAISAFPNPVINFSELKIKALKTENVLFYLYATDGKLIATKSFKLIMGNNLFNWDLQFVPAGKYFISSDKNKFKTIQIIKQ